MTTHIEQLKKAKATQQHTLNTQKKTLESIEKIKNVTKLWDWMSLIVAVFVGWMLREIFIHDPQAWAYIGTVIGCLFIVITQVLNQRRLREACEMFRCVFLPNTNSGDEK